MLIDRLLERRIETDIDGEPGDEAGQLLGASHQKNIAYAELLQRLEFATVTQPDLVVGRHRRAAQLGVAFEDPLREVTKLLRRGEMLRFRVGVLAGRRRQVFAAIAPFEVAQSCRGALQVLAGPRANQQIVGPHLVVQAIPIVAIAVQQHHADTIEPAFLAGQRSFRQRIRHPLARGYRSQRAALWPAPGRQYGKPRRSPCSVPRRGRARPSAWRCSSAPRRSPADRRRAARSAPACVRRAGISTLTVSSVMPNTFRKSCKWLCKTSPISWIFSLTRSSGVT